MRGIRTSTCVLGTTDPTITRSSDRSPGSPGQFERACEQAWPSLVRYLRSAAGPDLDIEDLAGQVMEIAWRKRASLVDVEAIVPWLLAIGHHVLRNGRRSWIRRTRLRSRLEEHRTERVHPSAHVELLRSEPGPAIRALATLAASDREVLVLHAWEDLDNAAIARVLDITPTAAAQRLHRARTRLANALASQEETP